MKLIELLTSHNHPSEVVAGCVLTGAAFLAAVIYEARRRHNQLKKIQRVCKYCHKAHISREHVPAKVSADLSGGFLRQLFSQGDYLCQTWVTCHSPGCSSNGQTYSEKTRPKHWSFWHKISRTGELRKMIPVECLIQDKIVRDFIESRKPKSTKKQLPFLKPSISPVEILPEASRPFPDVNLKGFKFTRVNGPK